MSKVAEIIETVKGLTVLELADLVKALEEEFGVSASASMVAAAPAAAAAEAEEKKSRPISMSCWSMPERRRSRLSRRSVSLRDWGSKNQKPLLMKLPSR